METLSTDFAQQQNAQLNPPRVETATEHLLDNISATFERGLEIVYKKNQDYANAQTDPFKNFRNSALITGISTERGILIRIMDKITRISNLLDKDPDVVEESINDTIIDAINYLAILKAYRDANYGLSLPKLVPFAGQATQADLQAAIPAVQDQPKEQTRLEKAQDWISNFLHGNSIP